MVDFLLSVLTLACIECPELRLLPKQYFVVILPMLRVMVSVASPAILTLVISSIGYVTTVDDNGTHVFFAILFGSSCRFITIVTSLLVLYSFLCCSVLLLKVLVHKHKISCMKEVKGD